MKTRILTALAALCSVMASTGETNPPAASQEKGVEYLRTINERSAKITTTLQIPDAARSNRVQQILVTQYRALNDVQWVRDVAIGNAKAQYAQDKAALNNAIQKARDATKPKLETLHGEFLKKISAELSPEQVDKVKDGLTYNVVHGTYNVYIKMYPELTAEQKQQIMAWLVEAREIAMDQGTADEKHAVFGKYKGRINNYLSKAGYDAKKGEATLKKATQPPSEKKSK